MTEQELVDAKEENAELRRELENLKRVQRVQQVTAKAGARLF